MNLRGIFAVSALLAVAIPVAATEPAPCVTKTLIAGQFINAGTASVSYASASNQWTIQYTPTGTWKIAEVHVHAACGLDGFPLTKDGNPKVGNFTFGKTYSAPLPTSASVVVSAPDCSTGKTYFAAHAVLIDAAGQTQTAWAAGSGFSGTNWATYFTVDPTTCVGTPPPPSAATCSQCAGLDCLLNPTVGECGTDQDVCTTTTVDTSDGVRTITRACDVKASALTGAALNSPTCENVEQQILSGQKCVFVCDGVTNPNCNKPPRLIPQAGRLTP